MKNINFYSLKLVKEESARYDVPSKVISPRDAYETIIQLFNLGNRADEYLVCVGLTTKSTVNGAFEISHGSLNASVVHPREVFKGILLLNSASMFIAHNHPSGDATPSKEDISITHRLQECSILLGIDFLDHIIVGDNCYTSLKEKGLL